MINMDVLVLTDTESETSVEQLESKSVKTYSFFQVEANDCLKDNIDEDSKYKDYEVRFQAEIQQWKALYFEAYEHMKRSQESNLIIDRNILSADQLVYLQNAPSPQVFVRDALDFRRKFYLFRETKYAEIRDMLDNLRDLCEQRLSLIMANEISDNFANTKKNEIVS
ncbi:uncharacterized protein LOC119637422 [Glossina fuscipes]|uniref:Uncharacterized protein LOC119637422 n=1 Tax=Glossina fuscipes TaxID=7396 RepID=A0A9C6DRV4_9MUSC|nr:uncharacterized protein LOC119637422 [Glossina fuscipes]KAI9581886.1 hypothetical protein GQX74_011381 [Glossina fuscipes]